MRPLLVTAGATRNPLDAIRYISAHSTGRTGVWLASQLATATPTHLLGSAEACLRAHDSLSTEEYTSTRDLLARMQAWCTAHPDGIIVHAAAVGDYEAAQDEPDKLPSGQPELLLRLRPTPKIIDRVRGWSPTLRLVSFKAAPPQTDAQALARIARAQLERTDSDVVFANVIGDLQGRVLVCTRPRDDWFADRQAGLAALVDWLRATV